MQNIRIRDIVIIGTVFLWLKIKEEHWEIKIVFNKYNGAHTTKITLAAWWEV